MLTSRGFCYDVTTCLLNIIMWLYMHIIVIHTVGADEPPIMFDYYLCVVLFVVTKYTSMIGFLAESTWKCHSGSGGL